jgi:hypothetical protein
MSLEAAAARALSSIGQDAPSSGSVEGSRGLVRSQSSIARLQHRLSTVEDLLKCANLEAPLPALVSVDHNSKTPRGNAGATAHVPASGFVQQAQARPLHLSGSALCAIGSRGWSIAAGTQPVSVPCAPSNTLNHELHAVSHSRLPNCCSLSRRANVTPSSSPGPSTSEVRQPCQAWMSRTLSRHHLLRHLLQHHLHGQPSTGLSHCPLLPTET